jgi:phosphoribosylformylglycinamidine synthase subunit PurL
MKVLTRNELKYLEGKLERKPNEIEQDIVGAQWSEHCSYKSSRKYLRMLPSQGKHVILGPGYDAGVLDVGDGYILTVHIESHNHPSAVEPFGGAATGVGGVIRDIMFLMP